MRTDRLFVLFLLLLLPAQACALGKAPIIPSRHGDFGHYTFALTWQPGFCRVEHCLPDQPEGALIGLHGLWPSRPMSLVRRNIPAPAWWRKGCAFYPRDTHPLDLVPGTRRTLDELMPHLPFSLLRHEYEKHAQCFGYDAEAFFRTALHMRQAVVDSAFGRYLERRARGHEVRRAQVVAVFRKTFHARAPRALQLRCGKGRHGRVLLAQLWITVPRKALGRFPQGDALMNAPIPQDNCPARFVVPDWTWRGRTPVVSKPATAGP